MGLAVLVGAAAMIVGWHFSQALLAHRAIPGRRAQLGPLRRVRTHHLLRVVGVLVLIVVILIVIAR